MLLESFTHPASSVFVSLMYDDDDDDDDEDDNVDEDGNDDNLEPYLESICKEQ